MSRRNSNLAVEFLISLNSVGIVSFVFITTSPQSVSLLRNGVIKFTTKVLQSQRRTFDMMKFVRPMK